MTKKIFAIILSVVLCMACCIPAIAADDEGFDIESILASDIAQQIMGMEGMSDITNVIIDAVLDFGSIDFEAMGKEKATAFIQNLIELVGDELENAKTNMDAFGTNPIDIVDRLFELEINETIENSKDPENSEDDLDITLGDVDADGVIDAADARHILRKAADLVEFTEEQFYRADVNKDGAVTAEDARIVLRIAAQLDSIENYL